MIKSIRKVAMLLFVATTMIAVSCSKENDDTAGASGGTDGGSVDNSWIVGKWRQVSGQYADGETVTLPMPQILEFQSAGGWGVNQNGQYVPMGTYSLNGNVVTCNYSVGAESGQMFLYVLSHEENAMSYRTTMVVDQSGNTLDIIIYCERV